MTREVPKTEGRHVSCESCRRRKAKCSRTPQCSMCTARGVLCTWAPGTGPSRTSEEADLAACEAEVTRLSKVNNQLTTRIESLEEELAAFVQRERVWNLWREEYLRSRSYGGPVPSTRDLPPPPMSHTMRSTAPPNSNGHLSAPGNLGATPRNGPANSSIPQHHSFSSRPHSNGRDMGRCPPREPLSTRYQQRPAINVNWDEMNDDKPVVPNLKKYEAPVAQGFASPRPRPRTLTINNDQEDHVKLPPLLSSSSFDRSSTSPPTTVSSGASNKSTTLEQDVHHSLLSMRHASNFGTSTAPSSPRLDPSTNTSSGPYANRSSRDPSRSPPISKNSNSTTSDLWQYRVNGSSSSKASSAVTDWYKSSSVRSVGPVPCDVSAERERHHPYKRSPPSFPTSVSELNGKTKTLALEKETSDSGESAGAEDVVMEATRPEFERAPSA